MSDGWTDLAQNRAGEQVLAEAERRYVAWRSQRLIKRIFTTRDDRSWRQGARGEALVARRLEKLGGDFFVLHSIPVGARGSDIDHLVIGPTGVFTINTKCHDGKSVWVGGDVVLVNGHRQTHVRNGRHEVGRVSRVLSGQSGWEVPVTGLVVVTHDKDFTVKSQPPQGDVRVTTPRAAVRWMRKQPIRLDMDQVQILHGIARRSTTWLS